MWRVQQLHGMCRRMITLSAMIRCLSYLIICSLLMHGKIVTYRSILNCLNLNEFVEEFLVVDHDHFGHWSTFQFGFQIQFRWRIFPFGKSSDRSNDDNKFTERSTWRWFESDDVAGGLHINESDQLKLFFRSTNYDRRYDHDRIFLWVLPKNDKYFFVIDFEGEMRNEWY